EERVARVRALEEARQAEAEAKKRAEEEAARRAEEDAKLAAVREEEAKLEAEAAALRPPQETAALETKSAPQPGAKPAPAQPERPDLAGAEARAEQDALRGRAKPALVEEEEEDEEQGKKKARPGAPAPKKVPGAGRNEPKRRSGKLTISRALSDED